MDEAVQEVAEPQDQSVETQGAETAGLEQQQPEVEAGATPEQAERRHPLEPGGDRFKEVYARAKRAEEEKEALKERLHQAELERARLEGERKAAAEAKQQQATEREYSWDELENFIEAGRITRAQANAYKEERIAKRVKADIAAEVDAKLNVNKTVSTINEQLERYKAALPTLMQAGTPERQKYEAEYSYLVNVLGDAPNYATQLKAARAAFGSVETVENAAKTRQATRQERPSFMDTATQKPATPKTKDPVDTLPQAQKDFYVKLIKAGKFGQYQGVITDDHWKEVRKELTWERGKR